MSDVLFARPCSRLEGKKQLFGYLVVTDDKLVHVSPKHMFMKIMLVGFVPYLTLGSIIARRHAEEWAASPPDNSRAYDLDDVAEVKRGRIRMNTKAPNVVTKDGQDHVYGLPYKTLQPVLSRALVQRTATVEPL